MYEKFHNQMFRMPAILAACLFGLTSCIFIYHEPKERDLPDPEVFGRVNILYSAGHNNLSSYLLEDIKELAQSSCAIMDHPNDALIVFSHSTDYRYNPTEPKIIRVRPGKGKIVYDTLLSMPSQTISANADVLNEVLTYIRDRFPAEEYNMVFSSHCSGYLPEGYLLNSAALEREYAGGSLSAPQRSASPVAYPLPGPVQGPLTKGIGADYAGSSSASYEMSLTDFAQAIPMKLNAVIFDACFMGGIETAYELKEKCNYLIASQTEILADGMDYNSMGKRLFGNGNDLVGLAEDYFTHYENKTSPDERSATISMIDCTKLEPLAEICNEIFTIHGTPDIDYRNVQRYYRTGLGHYHGFYDFRDIIEEYGCSREYMERIDNAIRDCIVYKAATKSFLSSWGGFEVVSHSGLSMYLPAHKGAYGNAYLNAHYKEFAWNKATGLVK